MAIDDTAQPAVRKDLRPVMYLVCRNGAEFPLDRIDDAYNHVAACMQVAKYGEKGRDRYGHGMGGPVHGRLSRWLRWRDSKLPKEIS